MLELVGLTEKAGARGRSRPGAGAGIGEETHAGVVVGAVVDSVDADGVDTELLELLNVALAASLVSDGVLRIGSATGLVVNTTDVETLVASKES